MKYNKVVIMLGTLFVSSLLTGCNHEEKEIIYLESVKPIERANLENEDKECSINSNYYFNQLTSEKDKEMYQKIYESLINREESFELKTNDTKKIKIWFKCVIYDNPEIFYVNNYSYMKHEDSITVIPIYVMTEEEQIQAEKEIEAYKEKVFSLFTEDMKDYDREKVIYDFIAENTIYTENSDYNQTIYSVVKGKSVCLGYSRMFQYLCEKAGIHCTIVTGSNSEGIGHAWNSVCIDGNWYMIDCTNSKGQLGDPDEKISYYYFNITKEQLLRSYAIDNLVKSPDCNSIESEYFKIQGLYFESADIERYKGLIEQARSKEENSLTIRCSNPEVYKELVQKLIEEKGILNMFDLNTSISKIADSRLLIIKVDWR